MARVGQRAHEPVAPIEERRYPDHEPPVTPDQARVNAERYLGAVLLETART